MADLGTSREQDLEAQGWVRRFAAAEPRLSEVVDLYKSLGFEVRLEPVVLESLEGECRECLVGWGERYKTVWTKTRAGSGAVDEADRT